MAKFHTVVAGDTIDRIARSNGFRTWRRIWNDAGNQDLRRIRPDPLMLAPDDRVWVPDRDSKYVTVDTNNVHEFVLGDEPVWLELRICDPLRLPLVDFAYRVRYGSQSQDGIVPADGRIRVTLDEPNRTEPRGELHLWAPKASPETSEPTIKAVLQLGFLGPSDTVYGRQGRLSNLGYYAGELDGVESDELRQASERFRTDAGLDADTDIREALVHAADDPSDLGLKTELDPGDRPALLVTDRALHLAPNRLANVCINAHPLVRILDMEDVNFHYNSSVFLPQPNRFADDPLQRRCAGLAAVRAVLRHAKNHENLQLLCAGHTDTVGSKASNVELSQRRADNVRLFLEADADGWADHCDANHRVEDYQQILSFLARHRGYECDPGEIDDDHGTNTERALGAFRSAAGAELGTRLPSGPVSKPDWKAFFELFEQMIGPHREDVQLKWADPKTLACGESFPIDDPDANNRRSAINRRVELLFCHPEHVAELTADPGGAGIYGPDAECRRTYLDPSEPLDAKCTLRLIPDAGYTPPAGARLRLVSADGTIERVAGLFDDCSDCSEYFEVEFTELDRTATYTLWNEGEGPATSVFQNVGFEDLARLSPCVEDDDSVDDGPVDGDDPETGAHRSSTSDSTTAELD